MQYVKKTCMGTDVAEYVIAKMEFVIQSMAACVMRATVELIVKQVHIDSQCIMYVTTGILHELLAVISCVCLGGEGG